MPSQGLKAARTSMVASPTLCGRAFRSGCRYKARQLGAREADLLRDYPALRAEDLANTWANARTRREEIERQMTAHETA